MNSGTPASLAFPDRSSFGMIRLASAVTVAISCGVKYFGLYGALAAAADFFACCACWCACCASASVHAMPAIAGAAPSTFSTLRRFMLSIVSVSLDRAARGAAST